MPEAGDARDEMLAHLHALVATIDAQHLNTRDHSQNVAAYAAAIGESIGAEVPDRVRQLMEAGRLGKKSGAGFYEYGA